MALEFAEDKFIVPQRIFFDMNLKIIIRNEKSADVDAITEVTVAAFKTLEMSNHTEQFSSRGCVQTML